MITNEPKAEIDDALNHLLKIRASDHDSAYRAPIAQLAACWIAYQDDLRQDRERQAANPTSTTDQRAAISAAFAYADQRSRMRNTYLRPGEIHQRCWDRAREAAEHAGATNPEQIATQIAEIWIAQHPTI